jgi:ElaB/YqjD/DUF883 family membrane-anchored ribosome-binding protein
METTETTQTSEKFPNTRKDVSDLKDTAVGAAKDLRDTAAQHLDKAKGHVSELKTTAVEAAKDLKSTASGHAEKAKSQLRDLASHAQAEGAEQLQQVRGQLSDLTDSARAYVSARPLAAVGVALAVGFLVGLTRRR